MAGQDKSSGKNSGSESVSEPTKVKLTFVEDFCLSGLAAVTSKTASAPIERIKMVIQNQVEMVKSGALEKPFVSVLDCTKWIYKEEGFAAFWKSNFTNCIRYFPTQALNFSFKEEVRTIQSLKRNPDDSYFISTGKNVTAGGLAGTGSLTFVYSLDYARTRLANDMKSTKNQGSGRKYSGLFDVYKKTIAEDGVAGLYRGFTISAVGIFVYRGLYFGLYDSIMPLVPKENSNVGTRFAVGYCVTVAAGLASYPIDTIRRRMMMAGGLSAYKGSLDCATKIFKEEGVKSFFKGAAANVLRGVAGAGVLALFDTVKITYVNYAYGPGHTV
jgi:solute carrier family 25 (adenine nucleotide translocator) protein 4/5/6/31